jgi:tetratricopeptide (TPR) repeat protein
MRLQNRNLVSLLIVTAFVLTTAFAQKRPTGGGPIYPGQTGRNPDIVVRVRVLGSARADKQTIQVDLLQIGGNVVARNFADDSGVVVFGSQNPGQYKVRASGMNFVTVESQLFEVYASEFTHQEMLETRLRSDAAQNPAPGFVSAHDAQAPENAHKEFEKGQKLLGEKKFSDAETHLAKALALYPQYDSAYQSLGNAYLLQKKQQEAEATFRKGLDIAPENPRLEASLGHVLLQKNDVDAAEPLLKKSVAQDPLNEATLALLTRAEYQKNNCDAALDYAKKAHALKAHREAFVHLIAGSCLEQKSLPADAAREYEVFLKEDPANSNAHVAQERLKAIAEIAEKLK